MIQMIAPGDAVVPKQNTGGGGSFTTSGVGRKQVLAKRKAEAAASNFGTQKSAAKRENYVLRTINGVPTRLPANFANLPAAVQEYILQRWCDDSLSKILIQDEYQSPKYTAAIYAIQNNGVHLVGPLYAGHAAVILIKDDGTLELYSYGRTGGLFFEPGITMTYEDDRTGETLPYSVEDFLATGRIPVHYKGGGKHMSENSG